MSVTPTGDPAWVRTNGHETYGGRTDKENYQSQGAINGQTDVDAADFCRLAADLAAVARTAPLCTFTFTCNDTSPAAPTMGDSVTMLPAHPTGTRIGNGDVRWTFDASYLDPYGVEGAIHIIGVTATLQGSNPGMVVATPEDSNADGRNDRVRVTAYQAGGAAASDAVVTISISTGQI
jgi:hypothetical protein